MAEVWILVFLFKGALYASGPYDLNTCLVMAEAQPLAACVRKDRPGERVVVPESGGQR